jgi:protein O-mannosyl-transferase
MAALAAFGASLLGAFQFDDFALLSDPGITSPGGWLDCFRLTQTRPLTWFTFWLNYQIAGETAAAWHAVNLALHVAVTLVLLGVLRRLIPARAAFAGALLFAAHPIFAEPVNYIFARGTLLAALFSLLAVRSWVLERRWIAVVWFAAAMLAKEECAALPVVLLLLEVSRRRPLRRALSGPLLAMFGLALALGLRVVWATTVLAGTQAGVQAGISPLAYFAAEGTVVWRYARMVLAPWGFTVDAEIARPAVWLAVSAWGAVAAVCVAASRCFRDLRGGFWVLAGLALLAPSSTIFPAADLAADRRMYLPMIAFSAGVGLLAARLDRRVLAAIAGVLVVVSVHYSLIWRTPEALWTEAKMQAPYKVRPRLQLARVLPPPRAFNEVVFALAVAPNDPAVYAELGRVNLAWGRPGLALEPFGRALALDPNDARALNNRGAALAQLGQMDAAHADLLRALSIDPCLFDARLNLKRLGFAVPEAAAPCRYTPGQIAQLER